MAKAKIFQSGNSQAVRLPKEFRFDVKEVDIFRRGDEVVLRKRKRNLARRWRSCAECPMISLRMDERTCRPRSVSRCETSLHAGHGHLHLPRQGPISLSDRTF